LTESRLAGVDLRLIESIDDAMDLKRWLGERHDGPVAIDTESGGLSPYRHRLRMVQVGDKRTGWSIPCPDWNGVAKEILNSYDGEWVAHNGVYDWRVIKHHLGIELPWHKMHDTLSMARLDDPTRLAGLKPLSKMLLDRNVINVGEKRMKQGFEEHGWDWDTVPHNFPPYWQYSSLDPILTAHLDDILRPRVLEKTPWAYDLERSANRICAEMMDRGVRIDVPYVEQAILDYAEHSKKIRAWLTEVHNITSPLSGGELSRAFEAMGEDISYTDKGNAEFNKKILQQYMVDGKSERSRQLAKYILAARRVDKMPHDYLHKFLDLRNADDILHININVMGARTGRMSVDSPPLQQLPRDEKQIRGGIIPREGCVFVTCDLDQAELRIIADLSGDEGLIAAFHAADNGGDDFFTTVTSELHQVRVVKEDPRRQLTKNFCYAWSYGGGDAKLASTAGVPIETIRHIKKLFSERFPRMVEFKNRLEREAVAMRRAGEHPGVYLASGRFLPCEPGDEYVTLNYRIQGFAAEYMKMCLIRADSAGLGEFFVLPIHDEILMEVPIGQAEWAARTLEEAMTDRTSYKVPMTAGAKILTERWVKS
jgi:DNA polymerase-1